MTVDLKGALNSVEIRSRSSRRSIEKKDRLHESGQGRDEETQWSYFDIMDWILGHKPTTVPECVVDSLALMQNEGNTRESPEVPEEVNEVDETLFGEENNGDETVAPASTETSGDNTRVVKKGNHNKKKGSRGDQFEVVMNGVTEELVSAQERNEDRY